MIFLHTSVSIGDKLNESVSAVCPHCRLNADFETYEVKSTFSAVPLPKSKAFFCKLCGKPARKENRVQRVVNFVFLTPLLLIVAASFVAGLVAMPLSYYHDNFDGFTVAIAIVLMGVPFFLIRRIVGFLKRNFDNKALFPLGPNLRTDL